MFGMRVCWFTAFVLAVSNLSPLARAAQNDPCSLNKEQAGIPGFVDAVPTSTPKPAFPPTAADEVSEGWVCLEYAITPQGAVRDVSVVDAVGRPAFVNSAIKAVSTWRYNPATRNGRAVEQHFYRTSVLFLMEGSRRNAEHEDFVRKYNRARSAIGRSRFDEAIAALESALKSPESNIYEQANASYLLAYAYAQKGDFQLAHFHVDHAFIENGKYLAKQVMAEALGLAVQLRAYNGDFSGAKRAFMGLRELDPGAGGRPATIAAQIDAAIASPAPLITDVRLVKHPLIDAPGVWHHELLRSRFLFAAINGEVRLFRLACKGAFHEAPVDPTMAWDVPSKAGLCVVRVEGAPNATFKFIEQ